MSLFWDTPTLGSVMKRKIIEMAGCLKRWGEGLLIALGKEKLS